MAYDTLELACAPTEEPCEQVGGYYDRRRARAECRALIGQLVRMHGEPPEGVRLIIAMHRHDFGTYHEVAVQFDDRDEAAIDYAFKLERKLPAYWDAAAREELGIGRAFR